MEYTTLTCREFTELLASRSPTPGGGGASALVGAVGTALGNMVGSLTVGKKKYAAVEQEMREWMKKADSIRQELLSLAEKDAEVFEPLSRVYGMPAATEEERQEKSRLMEIHLKSACSVPMKIMEKCCEAILLAEEFARNGSVLAVSDAGVSAALLNAALKGAGLNVFINTKAMKDRATAEELNRQAEEMLEKYCPLAEKIHRDVYQRLR